MWKTEKHKLTFLRRLSSSAESSLQCVLLEFLHQFVALDFLASSSAEKRRNNMKIDNSTTSEKHSHQKFIAQSLKRNISTNRGKKRESATTTFTFAIRNYNKVPRPTHYKSEKKKRWTNNIENYLECYNDYAVWMLLFWNLRRMQAMMTTNCLDYDLNVQID